MKNSVIYGSPATVIERIREYETTGIQQMMGMFIWDAQFLEHSARSFRLFIDAVLPHVNPRFCRGQPQGDGFKHRPILRIVCI